MQKKLLRIVNMDVDTNQLLTIYSTSVKYLREKWEYSQAVRQLFIDFKKAYDPVRRDAVCRILIEYGIVMI